MSFRDTFFALLGIYSAPRPPIHDDRAHAAANLETVMMAKLHLADRAGDRILGPIIEAQRSDAQSDDLRRGAEAMRQTLEQRARQDTLDRFVHGARKP